MKTILYILAMAICIFLTACRPPNLDSELKQRYVGSTVGEYLHATKTTFQQIAFLDEPPGCLRDLLIKTTTENETNVVLIHIDVLWSDPSLSRSWKEDLVRAAKIKGIEMNPKTLVK
jgi:hypothetical protein